MATATIHCQHNGSVAGIHVTTMGCKWISIPGTYTFALLGISCFVHAQSLPFSGEDPPGSG